MGQSRISPRRKVRRISLLLLFFYVFNLLVRLSVQDCRAGSPISTPSTRSWIHCCPLEPGSRRTSGDIGARMSNSPAKASNLWEDWAIITLLSKLVLLNLKKERAEGD